MSGSVLIAPHSDVDPWLDVRESGIPEALKTYPFWLVWRAEERTRHTPSGAYLTKVPYGARTGHRIDATTTAGCVSFDEALAAYRRSEGFYAGIGVSLFEESPLIGIDEDHCVGTDGRIDPEALVRVRLLGSYTERSPSGTGLRTFLFARKPGPRCRKGTVEIYDRDRFLTVTGHHLEGTPLAVEHRQAELEALYRLIFGLEENSDDPRREPTPALLPGLPPDDQALLVKMHRADNGAKFSALWRGDTSGYDSASEADLALCNMLAFWTQGNVAEIDRLFRRSGLMRAKWDERRGDETYGARTVAKAARQAEHYDPAFRSNGSAAPVGGDGHVRSEPSPIFSLATLRQALSGLSGSAIKTKALELIEYAASLSAADLLRAESLLTEHADASFARRWTAAVRKTPKPNSAGSQAREDLHAAYLARLILSEEHFTKDRGRALYRYRDGVYRPGAEEYVRRRLQALLDERGASAAWSRTLQADVVEYITVDAPLLDETWPWARLNLLNGILDIHARRLEPHTPELLTAVQFNLSYDREAVCPALRQFAREVLPDDAPYFLAEALAWCLMTDNPGDQSVMLRGAGGNGKSILLDVLTHALGPDNVSAIELHELVEDKFAAADLYLKTANIAADITSDHLRRTGPFKALTGGDLIRAQRKFGHAFQFLPRAKLLFSANKTPHTDDTSPGFFRRWIVVPFTRTFTGPGRVKRSVLTSRLTSESELSGLLNWALERWNQVAEHGLTLSETMLTAWNRFRLESNPFGAWLADHVLSDPEAAIPCKELLDAYNDFARTNTCPIYNQTSAGRALKEFFPEVARKRATGWVEVNGKLEERPYLYKGLRRRTPEDEEVDEAGDAHAHRRDIDDSPSVHSVHSFSTPRVRAGELTKESPIRVGEKTVDTVDTPSVDSPPVKSLELPGPGGGKDRVETRFGPATVLQRRADLWTVHVDGEERARMIQPSEIDTPF